MPNHSFTAVSNHFRPELCAKDFQVALNHIQAAFPRAFFNSKSFNLPGSRVGQCITVPGEDVPNRAAFRKAVAKLVRSKVGFIVRQ